VWRHLFIHIIIDNKDVLVTFLFCLYIPLFRASKRNCSVSAKDPCKIIVDLKVTKYISHLHAFPLFRSNKTRGQWWPLIPQLRYTANALGILISHKKTSVELLWVELRLVDFLDVSKKNESPDFFPLYIPYKNLLMSRDFICRIFRSVDVFSWSVSSKSSAIYHK
jgi:hypothetical protein